MRVLALLAVMVSSGCLGAIHGTGVHVGTPVATVTASEAGGLRVLASAQANALPLAWSDTAELAANDAELAVLWSDLGLDGDPPAVDFATHIVIGANFGGGPCDITRIVAAHIDARGTLALEERRDASACSDILIPIAKAVALPRALVGRRFTWRIDEFRAYVFDVPQDLPWPRAPIWPPPMRGSVALDQRSGA